MYSLPTKVKRTFSRIKRVLRKSVRLDIRHSYDLYALTLPANHLLPVYQNKYPLYDRFLPHLAKFLPQNTIVIDVGANVGDTTLSMHFANPQLKFISFEPDKKLFKYLQKNVRQMAKGASLLFSVAVSDTKSAFSMNRSKGTASISLHSQLPDGTTNTLDNILSQISEEFATWPISCIKSDTDGHDARVLLSGLDTVNRYKPLLFLECLITSVDELRVFDGLFSKFEKSGYVKCWIFSNTGALTNSADSFESLIPLLKSQYDKTQVSGYGQYVDLLFASEEYLSIAEKSVQSFGKE